MSWNRDWSASSWSSSSWKKVDRRVGTTVTGSSPKSGSLPPNGTTSLPSSFSPDWEFYDRNSVQSTPWSTKNVLAGKDVAEIRVADLTRNGSDAYRMVSSQA